MEFKAQLKWKRDARYEEASFIQTAYCKLTKMKFTVFPKLESGKCGYSIDGDKILSCATEEEAKEICETVRIDRVKLFIAP